MRRSGTAKFPNSVQLFKFCQKVMVHQKGSKVHDQEVGAILNFNPSDCSHWKRGEKNVKSVFSLAKLAEVLQVEISLIHDVASGAIVLEEAFFEYKESKIFKKIKNGTTVDQNKAVQQVRNTIDSFVNEYLQKADFSTPPLYLPEVMRFFSFVSTQPIDMMDKLSRILRVRPNQYLIQFSKGELKPQTRMSMTKDLARIIFEAERSQFPVLGPLNPELLDFEKMLFTASLLAPKSLILDELNKLDARRNVVSELATLFWVPKSLIGFQLQDILRSGTNSFPTLNVEGLNGNRNSEKNHSETVSSNL